MTAQPPADIAQAPPWFTAMLLAFALLASFGAGMDLQRALKPSSHLVRVGATAAECPVFGLLDRQRRPTLVAVCSVTWSEVTRP